jgi:hypothetical protein
MKTTQQRQRSEFLKHKYPDNKVLKIWVIVNNSEGLVIADYSFNMNDDAERRAFAERAHAAYMHNQSIFTTPDKEEAVMHRLSLSIEEDLSGGE